MPDIPHSDLPHFPAVLHCWRLVPERLTSGCFGTVFPADCIQKVYIRGRVIYFSDPTKKSKRPLMGTSLQSYDRLYLLKSDAYEDLLHRFELWFTRAHLKISEALTESRSCPPKPSPLPTSPSSTPASSPPSLSPTLT